MGMPARRLKYRRGDVKLGWRGDVAVADVVENGKRRRTELGRGLTDAQAKAALDQFCEMRLVLQKQTEKLTVGALWQRWLEDRAQDGFDNAIYSANWASLAPHFSGRYPEHVTADVCREYARQRFGIGRAAATVHTELVRLRHCLAWAHKTHLIPQRPVVWLPKRGAARKRVLNYAEAEALLAARGDHHIHVFTVLAFATAARHRAILDLTWDRVDFEGGTIQFDEQVKADPMSKAWRKTRVLAPMGTVVREVLQAAYAMRQSDYVVEHGGRRLKSVKDGFGNKVARAGLGPGVTPHTIRHTVNTWLQEKGIGLEIRARLLGHQDVRTNAEVYSHAGPSILSDAVAIIDDAIGALPTNASLQCVASPKRGPKKGGLSSKDRTGKASGRLSD